MPPGTTYSRVGATAAIDAIRRRTAIRVHGDTPILRLMAIEDRYQARIGWKERTGRKILDAEKQQLESARNELLRRPKLDVQDGLTEWLRRNHYLTYFLDDGPFRRELYPKHMLTIGHTLTDEEVMFMAANKVGKTRLGAYMVNAWTTGRYPKWWHGRVFDDPITAWICNKTAKDCRDINEAELLGPPGIDSERGTAMLPAHLIGKCTPKPGTPHAFEFIQVEHVSGSWSTIATKSYDQGREAFQGRNIPVIWNDEEVPDDIAGEEKLRIMTVNGLILYTYTPIQGLTEMTQKFMEDAGLSLDAMRHGGEALDEEF